MARFCRSANVGLRPHAKSHKSVTIARLQQKAGAIGVCVATVREAAVMVEAGIDNVLLTTPLTGATKLEQFVSLVGRTKRLYAVADNPENVIALERHLKRARKRLPVLVDVDLGMKRTGLSYPGPIIELARRIASSRWLTFAGLQCYSGIVQHIERPELRMQTYCVELKHLKRIVAVLSKAGLRPEIVTGGGTGTFDIDRHSGIFTDLQPGSYVFMDLQYEAVQLLPRGRSPFKTALHLQSMVISHNQPGIAVVDAGYKSFATDGPKPRPGKGAPAGSTYAYYGDEFGGITVAGRRTPLPLGTRIEFVTPHCDPTVNLHNYYHCVRGDVLVDIWPVDARGVL